MHFQSARISILLSSSMKCDKSMYFKMTKNELISYQAKSKRVLDFQNEFMSEIRVYNN